MGLIKTVTPVAVAVAVVPTIVSPLGKACARMDLTAVHDMLLKTGYRDEEGAENEVSIMHNNNVLFTLVNNMRNVFYFLFIMAIK